MSKQNVYYSVDLDFFSSQDDEANVASIEDVRTALASLLSQATASGIKSVHLARDHRPDLLRGWAPGTIRARRGRIVNLDSHDDVDDLRGGVHIGNWATLYQRRGVQVHWTAPPHGGWVCRDCRTTFDHSIRHYWDVLPLSGMASLAFFASPGYSCSRGYELMVLMMLVDLCTTHGIRINNRDPGTMTAQEIRGFVY